MRTCAYLLPTHVRNSIARSLHAMSLGGVAFFRFVFIFVVFSCPVVRDTKKTCHTLRLFSAKFLLSA